MLSFQRLFGGREEEPPWDRVLRIDCSGCQREPEYGDGACIRCICERMAPLGEPERIVLSSGVDTEYTGDAVRILAEIASVCGLQQGAEGRLGERCASCRYSPKAAMDGIWEAFDIREMDAAVSRLSNALPECEACSVCIARTARRLEAARSKLGETTRDALKSAYRVMGARRAARSRGEEGPGDDGLRRVPRLRGGPQAGEAQAEEGAGPEVAVAHGQPEAHRQAVRPQEAGVRRQLDRRQRGRHRRPRVLLHAVRRRDRRHGGGRGDGVQLHAEGVRLPGGAERPGVRRHRSGEGRVPQGRREHGRADGGRPGVRPVRLGAGPDRHRPAGRRHATGDDDGHVRRRLPVHPGPGRVRHAAGGPAAGGHLRGRALREGPHPHHAEPGGRVQLPRPVQDEHRRRSAGGQEPDKRPDAGQRAAVLRVQPRPGDGHGRRRRQGHRRRLPHEPQRRLRRHKEALRRPVDADQAHRQRHRRRAHGRAAVLPRREPLHLPGLRRQGLREELPAVRDALRVPDRAEDTDHRGHHRAARG